MSTSQRAASRFFATTLWLGLALVAAGLITVIVGIGFDWSGFWGGAGLGVGIGSALVGVYLCGFSNGIRKGARIGWLPSRGTNA